MEDDLQSIMEKVVADSIWAPRDVSVDPDVRLIRWQVFNVSRGGKTTIHFVGRNTRMIEGRVSSDIMEYDSNTGIGISESGRRYELVKEQDGCDSDAMYVWGNWLHKMTERYPDLIVEDVTDHYVSV